MLRFAGKVMSWEISREQAQLMYWWADKGCLVCAGTGYWWADDLYYACSRCYRPGDKLPTESDVR